MKIDVEKYESELKLMFCDVFSENSSFVDMIFDNKLRFSDCFAVFKGNKIVSFLYAIKKAVKLQNQIKECIYIYGVGTVFSERGKGHMTYLINEAYKYYENKNILFLYLVPENASLFSMYEKLGFKTSFYLSKKTIFLQKKADVKIYEGDYYTDLMSFYKKTNSAVLSSKEDSGITLNYTKYSKIKNSGFLWEAANKTAFIREMFLYDKEDLENFLLYLGNKYDKAVITTWDLKTPYAMMRPYNNFKLNEPLYTNMNFD